jgi:hypothetical protein
MHAAGTRLIHGLDPVDEADDLTGSTATRKASNHRAPGCLHATRGSPRPDVCQPSHAPAAYCIDAPTRSDEPWLRFRECRSHFGCRLQGVWLSLPGKTPTDRMGD